MIYKKIETTTEEVMEFIRAAGIEVKEDPTAKAFQLELEDGSIIEMPSDFNIFEETSSYTSIESCYYNLSITENKNDTYVSDRVEQEFDSYFNPLTYVSAA